MAADLILHPVDIDGDLTCDARLVGPRVFGTEVGGCGAPLVTTEMTDLHGLRLDGSA